MEKKSYINNANWKRKLIKWKATEKKMLEMVNEEIKGKRKEKWFKKRCFV